MKTHKLLLQLACLACSGCAHTSEQQGRGRDALKNLARFILALDPASAFQISVSKPSPAAARSLVLDRRDGRGHLVQVMMSTKALSKKEQRAQNKLLRDLTHAMVEVHIPGNTASQYADALVELGVQSVEELPTLTPQQAQACKMKGPHRKALIAGGRAAAAGKLAAKVEQKMLKLSVGKKDLGSSAKEIVNPDGREEDTDDDDQEQQQLLVNETLDGARLDTALSALLPPLSRSYFSSLCEDGRVRVDGKVAKKSMKVATGSTLQVRLRADAELSVNPEPIDLNILHEDDSMLAINKPSGMVVHPGAGNFNGTFVNALAYHVQEQVESGAGVNKSLPDAIGDGLRPGIVHRLDRYTTGVLLAAKTLDAQRKLLDAFAARRVQKVYLGIVVGQPRRKTTLVNEPIGRHPQDRVRMAVVHAYGRGRAAISSIHRLATDGRLSLVVVRIGTGRTHQIRVHTDSIGCPVLGDAIYGDEFMNKKEQASRPLLHALQLKLAHPTTGKPLVLYASPPDDIVHFGAELAGVDKNAFSDWLAPRVAAVLKPGSDPEYEMQMEDLIQMEEMKKEMQNTHSRPQLLKL